MTSSQNVTQSVYWLRNLNFSLENLLNTYIFTMDSTYFVDSQPLNAVFPSIWGTKCKFKQNLKIWKSKMAAACDVIYLPIVAMETN